MKEEVDSTTAEARPRKGVLAQRRTSEIPGVLTCNQPEGAQDVELLVRGDAWEWSTEGSEPTFPAMLQSSVALSVLHAENERRNPLDIRTASGAALAGWCSRPLKQPEIRSEGLADTPRVKIGELLQTGAPQPLSTSYAKGNRGAVI
jgi:hypothetical protein